MKRDGVLPHTPHWWWNCYLYGKPSLGGDSGTGTGLDGCKRQFEAAWARIRATLTAADIAKARDGGERQARLTKAGYRWETVQRHQPNPPLKKGGCKRDRNSSFSKQELDREVRDVVTEMSGVT